MEDKIEIPCSFWVNVSQCPFEIDEDYYYEYNLDIMFEKHTYSLLSYDKTNTADTAIRDMLFEEFLSAFVEWEKINQDMTTNLTNKLYLGKLGFLLQSITFHSKFPKCGRTAGESA